MCTIFRWLRKQHVQSVREVMVSDEVEPSHSDEAIEACMMGLDVKIWNWQKIDLSSEVIFNSAENVEEVTMYSSGNNAVLVGWSGPNGLPKLEKASTVLLANDIMHSTEN
jgi:hypothetical protein